MTRYGTCGTGSARSSTDDPREPAREVQDSRNAPGDTSSWGLGGAAGRRAQIIVSTKVGNVRGETPEARETNGRPDYIRSACEASLLRLDVAEVDVLYLHRVDLQVPIEESVGALGRLTGEGCNSTNEAPSMELDD